MFRFITLKKEFLLEKFFALDIEDGFRLELIFNQ